MDLSVSKDVMALFILVYGMCVGGLVYWVIRFMHWCIKKGRPRRKKR